MILVKADLNGCVPRFCMVLLFLVTLCHSSHQGLHNGSLVGHTSGDQR